MFEIACPEFRMLCYFAPSISIITGMMFGLVIAGVALGWRRSCRADVACNGYELLILAILGLMIGSMWADDQGNPWWFLVRAPVILAIPAISVALPFVLALAVAATVREGSEISRRIVRIVLLLALVPVGYMTIYHSGIWPSRTTKAHMVTVFHRYRFVFDRIAEKYEAALPAECRPFCASKPPPAAPIDPELLFLQWWIGAGVAHWQTDGSLRLPWWRVGALGGEVEKSYRYRLRPPSPLLDDIETAPLYESSFKAFYQHLGGNWYMVWFSD